MSECKIEKTTVELYRLRFDKLSIWADITIDSQPNSGRIQIASDFGDWQYYWGSCGCSLKEFLTDLNKHYLATKFGESNFFDLATTIENLRAEIIAEFPYNLASKQNLFEELKELEESSCENEFIHKMMSCDRIMEFCGHQPNISRCISPRFTEFWDKIWPAFVAELKKELSPEPAESGS